MYNSILRRIEDSLSQYYYMLHVRSQHVLCTPHVFLLRDEHLYFAILYTFISV